jgi:hypothetical protein
MLVKFYSQLFEPSQLSTDDFAGCTEASLSPSTSSLIIRSLNFLQFSQTYQSFMLCVCVRNKFPLGV